MTNINIWLEEIDINSVSDQIKFFSSRMRSLGFSVKVSDQFDHKAINFVIENFEKFHIESFKRLNKNFNKRVGIILTEHLDNFPGSNIYFHNLEIGKENKYIHKDTVKRRVKNLILALEFSFGVVTLGELPYLRNFESLAPGIKYFKLGYPGLVSRPNKEIINSKNPRFLFSGGRTPYRELILENLSKKGLAIEVNFCKLVESKRDTLWSEYDCILNIPQFKEWPWTSPLRFISALELGLPTISIGTSDHSKIGTCFPQIDVSVTKEEVISVFNKLDLKNQFIEYHKIVNEGFDTCNEAELIHYINSYDFLIHE